jgi:hypothetical protein
MQGRPALFSVFYQERRIRCVAESDGVVGVYI